MSNDAHWFSVICWANDLRASTPNFSWVMLLTWSILWNLNVRCPRCLWVDVTRHREMPSVSMRWRHQAQGDGLGVYELTSPGTERCPRCLWDDVTRHREMPSVSMSWRHQAQGDALGVYELTSPGTGRCPRCLWVDVTRHREMPSVSMSWRHQAQGDALSVYELTSPGVNLLLKSAILLLSGGVLLRDANYWWLGAPLGYTFPRAVKQRCAMVKVFSIYAHCGMNSIARLCCMAVLTRCRLSRFNMWLEYD